MQVMLITSSCSAIIVFSQSRSFIFGTAPHECDIHQFKPVSCYGNLKKVTKKSIKNCMKESFPQAFLFKVRKPCSCFSADMKICHVITLNEDPYLIQLFNSGIPSSCFRYDCLISTKQSVPRSLTYLLQDVQIKMHGDGPSLMNKCCSKPSFTQTRRKHF